MPNIFSGLSNFLSGGALGDAQDFLTNAGKSLAEMSVPDLMALIPELQLQVQQGTMTPAQYQAAMAQVQGHMEPAQFQAALQEASNMTGVQSDQSTIQGARTALGQLDTIGKNKGLTDADRAQFDTVMNQANANAAQQRAGQLQQLQMQGNAGTGAELAARLAGTQSTANSNAAAGANLAQSAQARALAAIQAGLTGNTNLNQQLFGQEAQKASAQDVINQFNAQAKNAVSAANAQAQQAANLANFNTANTVNQQNAAATNTAAAQNASNTQAANALNFNTANEIAGKNVGIKNTQLMMPLQTAQQSFTNLLDKNKAAAAAQLKAGENLATLGAAQAKDTTGQLDWLGNQINGSGGAGGLVKTVVNGVEKVGKFLNGVFTPATAAEVSNIVDWASIPNAGAGVTTAADAFGSAFNGTGPLENLGDTATDSGWLDWLSDKNLKTDKKKLTDKEVDEMMATMSGYKYRYKGDKKNPMQAGILAQDMEKGMPDSVVNTPAGKMVQKPEAMSKALAVIANQHQRILKLEGKNNGK
jgi:hypothetical protein